MIPERIRALINKKHGTIVTYANLYDEILAIAKAARKEGYNKGVLATKKSTDVSIKNVRSRLSRGWSVERAMTEPVQERTKPAKYELIEDNPFSRIKV